LAERFLLDENVPAAEEGSNGQADQGRTSISRHVIAKDLPGRVSTIRHGEPSSVLIVSFRDDFLNLRKRPSKDWYTYVLGGAGRWRRA